MNKFIRTGFDTPALREASGKDRVSISILHISPTYYSTSSVIGGGERYVEYMFRAIRRQAEESGFFLESHDVVSLDRDARRVVSGEGVTWSILSGKPWEFASIRVPDLRARLAGADLVIVHQALTGFGLFVAAHAKILGKYVVGIDHGGPEHPLMHKSPEATMIFDFFLAYSDFASNTYRSFSVPIKIMKGPVDDEYYTIDEGVPRKQDLVVSVGRVLPHKGFERVITSLPGALRLIIAGSIYDKAYYNYLIGLIAKSKSAIEIRQNLGNSEIRDLLRSASIIVHPSTHYTYEGAYIDKPELLGLVPLEALCCGTPVLVSNAAALAELSSVYGCTSFDTDEELTRLLSRHVDPRTRDRFAPLDIRNSVVSQFGMRQFGKAFLREIAPLGRRR